MRLFFLILILALAPVNAYAVELDVQKFNIWKEQLLQDALKQNVSKQVFDEVLQNVVPDQRIVKLDGKQPHRTISFNEYLSKAISPARISRGVKLLRNNREILREVSEKYGVQPRFIVALWGIESDYGHNMGGFYVPQALLTLAYEGRRGDFFRSELIQALKIIENKHISIKDMKGSWAGAMGQSQFMPSSFFKFAADHDGDGKRDIWRNKQDIFASIANYLSQTSWDDSITWGRKVKLPENFEIKLADSKITKKINEWQKLGVRKEDNSNLPNRKLDASIVIPGGNIEDAYMVYGNYKTLLDWNRSLYFATIVGLLSDALAGK